MSILCCTLCGNVYQRSWYRWTSEAQMHIPTATCCLSSPLNYEDLSNQDGGVEDNGKTGSEMKNGHLGWDIDDISLCHQMPPVDIFNGQEYWFEAVSDVLRV